MEEILDRQILEEDLSGVFQQASKGRRFANHILDLIPIYALNIGATYLYFDYQASQVDGMNAYNDMSDGLSLLITYGIWVSYYFISEGVFKGKTFGKLITNTRAVATDYKPLTPGKAIKRSLIRLVPFEAFSFLGEKLTGWHDRWADTQVIVDKDWRGRF